MSLRRATSSWRDGRAALVTAAAFVALTACSSGGDDGSGRDDEKPRESRSSASQAPPQEVDTDKVLAELTGANGAVVRVHSAVRDQGGFVTVSATLKNEGDKPFIANRWHSAESSVKSKSSVSGATLVDPMGKKRYMILRDTDGECLCTTGLSNIKPNESRPIYAQFPSPPKDVKQVDFQLPGIPPARLDLSEG